MFASRSTFQQTTGVSPEFPLPTNSNQMPWLMGCRAPTVKSAEIHRRIGRRGRKPYAGPAEEKMV